MKTFRQVILYFTLILALFVRCDEEPLPPIEPDEPAKSEAPELTQKVNNFIEDVMGDVYLWYDQMPKIDTRYEFDSNAYFDKLLYTEDKWSFITDDVEKLENSFEGIEKSYGWSLTFGRFSNTNTIFALVEFVYPNTPASEIGLKRGDIIVEMFDNDITDENYRDLLNSENISVTLGVLSNDGISLGSSVSMVARDLKLNPVLISEIIEHEGHKIGYLMYAQYIASYNSSLDTVFQNFMDNQITDLVLDLRYNPGGGTNAAQHLCSSVAPLDVVNGEKTLVSLQWNDKYQDYWEQNNNSDQLEILFTNAVQNKMGLNKIHILTGFGTASASELSITGLKPYMNVTTVGETTFGKYTASITLKPEDFYESKSYYGDFENWGIQPIILRYANSLGVTDFKDGFLPDIEVEDDLWDPTPLGQKEEPLLKAAIEDITGAPILAIKSAPIRMDYTRIDRGFSKFDRNKREVIVESISKDFLK